MALKRGSVFLALIVTLGIAAALVAFWWTSQQRSCGRGQNRIRSRHHLGRSCQG